MPAKDHSELAWRSLHCSTFDLEHWSQFFSAFSSVNSEIDRLQVYPDADVYE